MQGQSPGTDTANKNESLAAVFNVRKYPPDYAAFTGRTLTQKGTIEITGTRFLNGASFQSGATAAGAIVTVVSDIALADSEAAASTSPLPTRLGGVSAVLRDSSGASLTCPLYYASKGQVNLVVPDKAARGAATLTLTRDSGASASGSITIDTVAPGLFTMGTSGIGAIIGLRLGANNQFSDVPTPVPTLPE